MLGILYALVIIIASAVGAVSGMGGGVLIKPIFDSLQAHSIEEISFYASVAVFVMSIVSTYRQVKAGQRIQVKIVLPIAGGAILGGYLGNYVFQLLLAWFRPIHYVTIVQIILTLMTLVFALWASRHKAIAYQLLDLPYYLLCGCLLGFLASFLGIGGGPINVSLLILMFSFPIKQATVYSIAIIFFSQLSKLLTIYLTGTYQGIDLTLLYYIIPAAILGGLIGAKLSKVLSDRQVQQVFEIIIILVMLINIYNAWKLLA